MTLKTTYKQYQNVPLVSYKPVLKVLGLGGGGCNAINRMIELDLHGVDFIAANTDRQALDSNLASVRIQLGPHCTRGLGAGGVPDVGEAAAEESYREIVNALRGADMVFLTAGMGGGTGTGSIAVAARAARSINAVAIAIVTTPFSFEAGRRQRNALVGLEKLRQYTDTLITVPNDRLLYVAPKDLPLDMAFRLADDVLRQGIQGITEIITETGMINVDFAHVRRLMQLGGGSLMSIGYGQGEGKARQAAEQALHHPLLDSITITSAAGIIANFTGGPDLSFVEVTDALNYLQEQAGNQAEIIPGITNDERMEDRAQVILIMTGLGATPIDRALPGAERAINTNHSTAATNHEPSHATSPRHAQNPVPFQEPEQEYESAATDLDIPAFIRKRAHYNQI
jgi:cell division protein FtsZ